MTRLRLFSQHLSATQPSQAVTKQVCAICEQLFVVSEIYDTDTKLLCVLVAIFFFFVFHVRTLEVMKCFFDLQLF